jgi:hypothetical protein
MDRQPMPAARARQVENDRSATFMDLVFDSLKLADLQLQLLQIDVVAFWKRSQWALTLLVISSVMLLSGLPVLLLGIAAWMERLASLSRETSLLIVGGVVFLIASGLLAWAVRRLGRAIKPLGRSHEELRANLAWMRHLLHREETGHNGQ